MDRWVMDVVEWAIAEEVRLKAYRRDERMEEDLGVWNGMLDKFGGVNRYAVTPGHNEGDTDTSRI